MTEPISIRYAEEADAALVLKFICSLARFEKLQDLVEADLETIKDGLFDPASPARCLLAFSGDTPVGFALFFFNFSTFLGRPGIYLEDLFIVPAARSRGVGRRLLQTLAKRALERNCGRLEWAVLDWNDRAIQFYEALGARPQDAWTVYRLEGSALMDLARD